MRRKIDLPLMNRFVLKEYGTWSVAVIVYLAGIVVVGSVKILNTLLGILPLVLIVNSKKALSLALSKKRIDKKFFLFLFIGQFTIGGILLYLLIQYKIFFFIPFGILLIIYTILTSRVGEQNLLSQLIGFVLLVFPFLIANLINASSINWRALAAILLFFTAAVFKIKALITRRLWYRLSILFHFLFTVFSYLRLKVPLWLLLPLVENLLVLLYPYNTSIKTQGWIELTKSLMYLILLIIFWK